MEDEIKSSKESCSVRRVEPDYANLEQPGDFYLRQEADNKEVYRITIWLPGLTRFHGTISILISQTKSEGVWKWDGNQNKPTLSPSIKTECTIPGETPDKNKTVEIWHGYMRNGRLESC